MPEHLASILQTVCWVGSTSLIASPNPPSTSMGPENQKRRKRHQSQKDGQMWCQAGLEGGWMSEHLAATLQRVCWVGSTSLMAASPPSLTSMGPENQERGKSHQGKKNGQMRRQAGLEGGWMPEHLASTLQRVCWVGSTSLTPAPNPPLTSMGPENQKRGKI